MTRDTIPLPPQVLERLAALGVEVERVAARAGLAGVGRVELTTEQYFAFWRALANEPDRADIGLLVGAQSPVHAYSISSVAALQAPTLGDALRTIARYKRLSCPEHVEIEVRDGEAGVRCDWLLATEDVPALLVDGVFASFAALAKRGSGGKIAPIRVELARRARHAALLRSHVGCKVVFGAPVDRLVFEERAFAARFVATERPLHLLINNAGIMAVPLSRDARGFEAHVATNHIGHFHLTQRLWPALERTRGARVVALSSRGHAHSGFEFDDPHFERRPYEKMVAYG